MTNNLYQFYNDEVNKETWAVDISGKHTCIIKSYLIEEQIPKNGINKIIFNAAKALGYCPNPQLLGVENKKTGLLIGKVQSGKTSSFITITSLAFDNGYNIVVVLGGTKTNLVEQNKNRIREYFEKDDSIIIFDTVNNSSQLTEENLKSFVENGRKIIIVTLKSSDRIHKLTSDLFLNTYFSDKPILIIDDEGDEYSLNAKVRKNLKSPTYESILNLLNCLKIRAFISVTATPQANLIIPTIDILSPDFGVLIEPGEGYCGLDTFHVQNSKYCIEIPDSEPSLLDNEGVPLSFYKALALFFVACAINKINENPHKKISMLIHPSHKVKDIAIVHDNTKWIIRNWKSKAKDKEDISFAELNSYLKDAYNEYENNGVDMISYENMLDTILSIINFHGLHFITGNNQLNDNDKPYDYNIYIGGQMVGRGLTIKGLTITYIIRSAKGISNVDTVQQRARWFGYKKDILDLCRVFATSKIINDFQEIRIHEEDMWETIKENEANGKQFKDMARMFILGKKLRPSRTSIGRTKYYSFSPWNIEDNYQIIEEYRKHNNSIIEQIMNDYEYISEEVSIGIKSKHKIIRNISFYDFVNRYLKNNFVSPGYSRCSVEYLLKVGNYVKKNCGDIQCNIVLMRDGKPSVHTVDNGKIHNYMVGRRPEGVPLSQCTYKGDREFIDENNITIQIHNILGKTPPYNQICSTLAIHIPKKYLDTLKNIIVPEESL